MCEKDGGVIILDQVQISKSEIDRHILPMTSDGKLGIPLKEMAKPDAPVYAIRKTTMLNDRNPQVGRVEWVAIRRADQAVVARWVSYGRSGGDLPGSSDHESHFSCPDPEQTEAHLQRLFKLGGEVK
jgi:hypothetical protein